jgi:hypothetical protein
VGLGPGRLDRGLHRLLSAQRPAVRVERHRHVSILLIQRYGSNSISKTERLTLRFPAYSVLDTESASGLDHRRADPDAHAF